MVYRIINSYLRFTLANVNTTTHEQLDVVSELKGHDFKIVRYCAERGKVTDLSQLDEVPGMAGKADSGRSALTVGDA